MKALIIAGGLGTRLFKYTKNKPKGMLQFIDKSLIEHQVTALRNCGITNIVIIRKHLAEKINIKGVRYCDEDPGAEGNMVRGLFHARSEFDDDLLVTYGDLIFEEQIIQKVINSKSMIGVVVDNDWREYWKARHGSDTIDTESMILNGDVIKSLGVGDPEPEKIQGRYVGIIRFSKEVLSKVEDIFNQNKKEYWDKDIPWYTSKNFKKAYMTDYLQCLIDHELPVKAILIQRGWLEFDTNEDYEKALQWAKEGCLSRFYRESKK